MSPPLPSGIQSLLVRARRDVRFGRELLSRRDAAAGDLELTPSERAILRAVPADQLEQMIAAVPVLPAWPERRKFLRDAGSAAVALLGGAALGAAALGPRDARGTPPGPPAGIRPDPPHFVGDVDVVAYRTVSGPARALPDQEIERRLAEGGLCEIPRTFEGRLSFRLVVDRDGRVEKATPQRPPAEHKAAAEKMALDLRRTRFRFSNERTTMTFDVVLTRRKPLREWSGNVELADLDVAGPDTERLRRTVRDLVPQMVARLKSGGPGDRSWAGKVRYAIRQDSPDWPVDVALTKNTSVPHHIAMGIRQLLADSSLPKWRGARWCRFSLVLRPVDAPPR